MNIFRLFKVKKLRKYAPKRTRLYHSKNVLGEACPRTTLANAWLRLARSQAALRHATRSGPQKVAPPLQILHTPMDYY